MKYSFRKSLACRILPPVTSAITRLYNVGLYIKNITVFWHKHCMCNRDGRFFAHLQKYLYAGKLMETEKERRIHERHQLKLDVFCQTVGLAGGRFYSGSTVDVSPSGVLVEIYETGLGIGQLISVDMPVPPSEDMLDYGGRFSGYARVCRTGIEQAEKTSDSTRAIALEFCDRSPLRT